MVERFASSELNKYLSDSSRAALWDSISAGSESELDRLLVEADVDKLMQVSGFPESPETAKARFNEVKNAVAKQATGRFSTTANAVRVGLDRLSEGQLRYNPSSSSFWGWYVPTITKHHAQRLEAGIGALISDASLRGAMDTETLKRRLPSVGLDSSFFAQAKQALADAGLPVVETLAPDVVDKIEKSSAPNIVALIQPWEFEQDPDLRYSAFKAAPEGGSAVTLADIERAITYYDSHRKQANKDAVSKLGSVVSNDQELRDAVLAYHLGEFNNSSNSPTLVANQFSNAGLLSDEVSRLQGNQVGAVTQAAQSEEEKYYRDVARLLDGGKVREARAMVKRLVDTVGQATTSSGKATALRVLEANDEADRAIDQAQAKRKAGSWEEGLTLVNSARSTCVDDKILNDYADLFQRMIIQEQEARQREEEERLDHQYWSTLVSLIESGKLAAASAKLDELRAMNVQETSLAQPTIEELGKRLESVNSHIALADDALQATELWPAIQHAKLATELGTDLPEVVSLLSRIDTAQKDPEIVTKLMNRAGYRRIDRPQYEDLILLPGRVGLTGHLLFLLLPAAIIDFFIVRFTQEGGELPEGTFLAFVLSGVLAWTLQAVTGRLSTIGGCMMTAIAVILSFCLYVLLASDGMWLTTISSAILAFNVDKLTKNATTRRATKSWNGFIDSAHTFLQRDGALNAKITVENGTTYTPVFPRPMPQDGLEDSTSPLYGSGFLGLRDTNDNLIAWLPTEVRNSLISSGSMPGPLSGSMG